MAFNKPISGDTIEESDINQIIEALDGSGAQGEPISITTVADATRYALDVMNLDAVHSFGLRVRKHNGGVIFRTSEEGTHFGANVTLEQGATIDGLLPAAHLHNGELGHGQPIALGGLGVGAVGDTNLAAQAVTTAALRDQAISTEKVADGAITAAKLWAPVVTGVEFEAHNDAPGVAHGLPGGAYVAGAGVQGAYLQGVTGQSIVNSETDFSIIVTWPTAFTTLISASSSFGAASGNRRITAVRGLSLSATGASHTFDSGYGDESTSFQESWIALGQ